MLTYATTAQLAVWTGTAAPANAATLLRSASILVRRATLTAIYDVDTTGLPTDAVVLAAFQDATCAQVATWAALGIDPAKGAAEAVVASKKIGSASITYAAAGTAATGRADARAAAAQDLCQEALLILADAGLVSARTGTFG